MRLKNVVDVNKFLEAVGKCVGDVVIINESRREEFNLKSGLSRFLGVARLIEEEGDDWDVYYHNKNDESHLLEFFFEKNRRDAKESA